MTAVSVARGTIIAYRVYDVADEFDLDRIESDLRAGRGSSRLKLARTTRHALVVRDAPVTLALGPARVRLGASPAPAELFARVWSYGVVSMQFHLSIEPGTTWAALVERAALVEDDNDIDDVAAARVREIAPSLAAAATLPHDPQGVEDYVIYFLERIEGGGQPCDLAACADIPALILGEPAVTLSKEVRQTVLESSLSYSTRDLAVIDWNSALVVDETGGRDLADILEFAVTHLMEFRYFDTVLDERLQSLYEAVEQRRRFRSYFRSRYGRLAREANTLYLEFSEHLERVENSLKFVGDFFLAAVFRRATSRFRLHDWEESVTRKVNALARVSEMLSAEDSTRRSHLLELVIIALILYEIVSAAVTATR